MGSADAGGLLRESRRTVGWSASFMTAPIVVYASICRKKHGSVSAGSRTAQLLRGFVEQGDPFVPQQFGGLSLGLLPGRDRLFDQPLPLRRQPEGLGAGILVRHDLQPAVRPHPFDVAAEGGRVQLQNLADLGGPGEPELGGHDQDVQLADLQAQRTQGVVVEVRDDPVQQPQPHGDALRWRWCRCWSWVCP